MIIEVKAIPNSREQKIEKISDKEYKINLKEKAGDNKANVALLKILRKYFGCEAKIIRGLKSKKKFIEIKCQ